MKEYINVAYALDAQRELSVISGDYGPRVFKQFDIGFGNRFTQQWQIISMLNAAKLCSEEWLDSIFCRG